MPLLSQDTEASGPSHPARFRRNLFRPAAAQKVSTIDRKPENGLEDNLSSAVEAADADLAEILEQVERMSRVLRSDQPDASTLRAAVHPAVWSAVKQALLDRELRCLALTDDLTCLYNRRGFFAAATQLLKLARRKGQCALLFFCDFDGLKTVNDSFGHSEGDLALVRTADALEHAFRSSDVLARLGGDEFVVLALEESGQTQDAVLHRLKKSLKKVGAGESRYKVSLSVGVARFDPKRPVGLGELMAQADRAMYQQRSVTRTAPTDASQR